MGLQGYLRRRGRRVDVLNDPEYDRIKQSFGCGGDEEINHKMHRVPISGRRKPSQKRKSLWQTKQLGDFNPGVRLEQYTVLKWDKFWHAWWLRT